MAPTNFGPSAGSYVPSAYVPSAQECSPIPPALGGTYMGLAATAPERLAVTDQLDVLQGQVQTLHERNEHRFNDMATQVDELRHLVRAVLSTLRR